MFKIEKLDFTTSIITKEKKRIRDTINKQILKKMVGKVCKKNGIQLKSTFFKVYR